MRTDPIVVAALAACAVLFAGCQRNDPPPPAELPAPADTPRQESTTTADGTAAGRPDDEARLRAVFQPVEDSNAAGEAELVAGPDGVRISAVIRNAPPGPKGIHVHETGDCSAPRDDSMGSHFEPAENPHGLPGEAGPRHLGDLGNIEIDEFGNGRLEITVAGANLQPGDPHTFRGRALILHEGRDVGASSQPSGDSGDPIACAVIR